MDIIDDITWKKEYETGNFEIDAEHKIFLKTIRKINEAYKRNPSGEYVASLIRELHKYAEFHFLSEENLMQLVLFPHYKYHHREHQRLLFEFNSYLNSFQMDYIDFQKFLIFVVDWFKTHTVKEDKKLAEYIQKYYAGNNSNNDL